MRRQTADKHRERLMTADNDTRTGFLREVDSQPAALRQLAQFYRGQQGAELLERWRTLLERHKKVAFIGMGTSEIAPLLVRDTLLSACITISLTDAGEYLHYCGDDPQDDTLHVLISQSGESAETRKAILGLADASCPTVAIVNDEDSTMARAASLVLPIKAGEEKSISNKTYLNTLAVLHLVAGGITEELDRLAGAMDTTLDEDQVIRAAEHLAPADSLHFIARGPALCSANQLALTFMEGARSHGKAFAGGAFRHGPYEVLGEDHRAVMIAPEGRTCELCMAMAVEMAEAGSRVVLVTDREETPAHENIVPIKVSNPLGEHSFPLAFARVQAWLLHHVARLRGFEAGVFNRVSKVTDVE
jgi:glutamine---fructose-6-phosphate transaminase (isomerizing)